MARLIEKMLKIYNNGYLCIIYSKEPVTVNRESFRTEDGVFYDINSQEVKITVPPSSLVIKFQNPEVGVETLD